MNKGTRKEIDQCLASVTKLNVSGHKRRHPEGAEQGSEKFAQQAMNEDVLKIKNKKCGFCRFGSILIPQF